MASQGQPSTFAGAPRLQYLVLRTLADREYWKVPMDEGMYDGVVQDRSVVANLDRLIDDVLANELYDIHYIFDFWKFLTGDQRLLAVAISAVMETEWFEQETVEPGLWHKFFLPAEVADHVPWKDAFIRPGQMIIPFTWFLRRFEGGLEFAGVEFSSYARPLSMSPEQASELIARACDRVTSDKLAYASFLVTLQKRLEKAMKEGAEYFVWKKPWDSRTIKIAVLREFFLLIREGIHLPLYFPPYPRFRNKLTGLAQIYLNPGGDMEEWDSMRWSVEPSPWNLDRNRPNQVIRTLIQNLAYGWEYRHPIMRSAWRHRRQWVRSPWHPVTIVIGRRRRTISLRSRVAPKLLDMQNYVAQKLKIVRKERDRTARRELEYDLIKDLGGRVGRLDFALPEGDWGLFSSRTLGFDRALGLAVKDDIVLPCLFGETPYPINMDWYLSPEDDELLPRLFGENYTDNPTEDPQLDDDLTRARLTLLTVGLLVIYFSLNRSRSR